MTKNFLMRSFTKAESTQDARCNAKEMGPIDVNAGVPTAHKQQQRKNIPICVRVASRVLCELGFQQDRGDGLPTTTMTMSERFRNAVRLSGAKLAKIPVIQ